MSEILIFTDIHIDSHKGLLERLDDCLKVLEWVYETARSNKIKNVIFIGDLFHHRQKINVYAYNKTFDIFYKNKDINTFLLLGNHDLYYFEDKTISSVNPLCSLPNVKIISEPCTITIDDSNYDFLPFTHNPIDVLSKWKNKSQVLFSHIAVDGAILNFNSNTKAEVAIEQDNEMQIVSSKLLEGWNKVFLGHYHGYQELTDKILYLGSPLQLTFSEANQKKYIAIYNSKTSNIQKIENTFSPKHYIVNENEIPEHLDRDFLRINIEDINSLDLIKTKKQIKDKSPKCTVTYVTKIKKEDKEKVKKINLDGDLFSRYIETFNKDLEPKKLMNIAQECISNAY